MSEIVTPDCSHMEHEHRYLESKLSFSSGITVEQSTKLFDSIVNFRDLGGFLVKYNNFEHRVKYHMLFRSGTPATGSNRDITILLDQFKIKTMIDLRSKSDYLKGERKSPYRTHIPKDKVHVRSDPFLGFDFVVKGVIGGAPAKDKIKFFRQLVTFRGTTAAKATLLTHVNSHGLFGMYTMFLEHCKAQICKILDTFTAQANYPIHYFCNAGKDRTGVISVLLLSILGVAQESIIDDYHKSDNDYVKKGAQRDAMESNLQKSGLSEDFMAAPKEVMAQTLWYVAKQYGSMNYYLDSIGFGQIKRFMVLDILLEKVGAT